VKVAARHSRCVLVAVLAAVASAGSGCSALFITPPRHTPLQSLDDCTPSVAPPILDAILTGVTGATAVIGLGVAAIEQQEASNETAPSWDAHTHANVNANTYLTVGLIAQAAALGLAVSTRYGFRGSGDCRTARRPLLRRQTPPAPPPFGYPPPPWGYPPAPPTPAVPP